MTGRTIVTAAMLLAAMLVSRAARAQQQGASAASAGNTLNPHGKLKDECATCHRADAWKPARVSKSFVHAPGRFPLEGAHASASCRSCHVSLDFKGVSSKCATCHQDIHRGELGAECSRCHTARSFLDRTVMQRAHQTTRFPLTGAHVTTDCNSCHTPAAQGQLRFVNRSTECVSCHLTAYNATANPPHLTAGFPQQCEVCHTTVAWNRARFDHNATTFPLTGAHRTVVCANCHGDGVYRGKSTACASCHTKDYNATTDPPHASGGFPTTCEGCHNTTTWIGATFDHNATRFPLTGAHKPLTCNSCHGDGVFAGKSTQCVSCHLDKYNATTDPKHSTAGFSTNCTTCHTTTTWSGATFDHSTTQFPLTGAHKPLACNACHGDGVYRGKSTACASCHTKDYNATTDPPHASTGFPLTCEGCHTTTTWVGATFNHNTTRFPLTGAHKPLACNSCHGDGVFAGKSTACVSCHLDKYNGTTDPKHSNAGFSTDCTTCHTTTAWTGATFNHSTTQFPLTGAHVPLACNSCHGDGVYKGKSTACVSCHLTDYNGTNNPPHAQAGFPSTCATCHTTTTWAGATFNHTYFPTNHGNANGTCSTCHTNSANFAVFTCTTCHAQGTTDSHHRQVSGYRYDSNACYSCHPRGRSN